MRFNSVEFFVLLSVVLAFYYAFGRRGQNGLLLVASYVFYGWWDWRFLGLLGISTLVDYWTARGLDAGAGQRRRRLLLTVSVAVNLSILGFFKYFDFFTDSAADLLNGLGFDVAPAVLDIVLPVGISFYTFQTMSYTIDVYRQRLRAHRSLLDFALFVAFMPQLVAGPIERAGHLLPQLETRRERPRSERLMSGAGLILLGLTKKVAIADAVAPYVNDVYANPGQFSAAGLIVGTVLFAIQIYGDFSGYTDIARGTSRLLGVELMENFAQPYLSRSVTEFWRRWHISFSTWLRDYLYVPLGGNRRGPSRTYVNLMLVMLIGGLWHGAAWTFVAWGILHGVALAFERWRGHTVGGPEPAVPSIRELPSVIGTFAFVCFAWVFFRAGSFGDAFTVIERILTLRAGETDAAAVAMLALAGIAVFAIDISQRMSRAPARRVRLPDLARGSFAGLGISAIVLFSGADPVPFIYFQF